MTDRPTDRPTDRHGMRIATIELLEQAHIRGVSQGEHHPYQYETDRILGTCRPRSQNQKFTRGGGDSKYRKLRGISEFSRKTGETGQNQRREPEKNGNSAGDANNGLSDKGEYP